MAEKLSELWRRVRALFAARRLDAELSEEMSFHLEMERQSREREGASPAVAAREARLVFGGEARHREAAREARGLPVLETAWRDAVLAVRGLRREPGFTAVALLTLGVAIGSSATVFSVVDGVLLKPLPYSDADQLHSVLERGVVPNAVRTPSYPTFDDWRSQSQVFSHLAYIRGDEFAVRTDLGTQRLIGAYVSADFFRMMGSEPLIGRLLDGDPSDAGASPSDDADDDSADDVRVVVLSHRLWMDEFGGDRSVLGRVLTTAEGSFTVIGVMPAGFSEPIWADLWTPIDALPPAIASRVMTRRDINVDARVFGRLAAGVTRERAEADLGIISSRLAEAHPSEMSDWPAAQLRPLRDEVLGDARGTVLLLSGAVFVVLLMANVNLANLLLARGAARSREMAVRQSLGAGRGRLVRQLLVEAGVLAATGGAIGTAGAWAAVGALRRHLPDVLPRMAEVALDGRALAFIVVLTVACPLLFALAPALRSTGRWVGTPLRSGEAGAGVSRGTVRLRSGLVVAQVALAVVLVISSGLLMKSLWRLQQVELGFDPTDVLAVRIFPPSPRYDDELAARVLFERLRDAAAGVPGVRTAALTNHLPLSGGWMSTRILVPGAPADTDPESQRQALYRTVSPEYFDVLGLPLRRGRVLGDADLAGPGAGGVVVNEAFVRAFFDGAGALGSSVTLHRAAHGRDDFGLQFNGTIVGIVGDDRFFGPASNPPATVYLPYTWNTWGNTFVVARIAGSSEGVLPTLRQALLAIDPELPIAGPGRQTQLRPMTEYVASDSATRRLNAGTLLGFAAAALLLALIGIVGVVGYVVAQRTRELGVRLALGARPVDVLAMVLGHALRLAAAGVLLGVVGAFAATRMLQSELFEVTPLDPGVYLAVCALFGVAAVAGGLAPGIRAARLDPSQSLRAD